MAEEKWAPRYSGPNRTGTCKCGHAWDEHHLGVVMNTDYRRQTGEAYVPQECEHFGSNEVGGLEYVASTDISDGKWVDHCHNYKDELE